MLRHPVWLVVLLVIFAIGCCVLLYAAGVPIHNYTLSQYSKDFHQVQHPPNTSLVKAKELVSRYEANGACVYFVGQLRRYSESRQEVQSFYAGQANNASLSHKLKVLFSENGEFSVGIPAYERLLPFGVRQVSDWQVSPPDLQGNLYLVYFSGVGDSYFDYRCK